MSRLDISGRRFGRLVAVEFSHLQGRYKHHVWSCVCDCGNSLPVRKGHLTHGEILSCGCLTRDRIKRDPPSLTHGASKTPEYKIWTTMRQRCGNPRATHYEHYGARGIYVCDRWQQFENFISDIGPRPSNKHSIDRIDNDGPYSPENCRWATANEQQRNKRKGSLLRAPAQSRAAA